ncbi:MAG: hypothetical protein GXO44_05565 [Deferribacteres bacterium]|nr:hypothetical protein [Deferribacteres bacterium]
MQGENKKKTNKPVIVGEIFRRGQFFERVRKGRRIYECRTEDGRVFEAKVVRDDDLEKAVVVIRLYCNRGYVAHVVPKKDLRPEDVVAMRGTLKELVGKVKENDYCREAVRAHIDELAEISRLIASSKEKFCFEMRQVEKLKHSIKGKLGMITALEVSLGSRDFMFPVVLSYIYGLNFRKIGIYPTYPFFEDFRKGKNDKTQVVDTAGYPVVNSEPVEFKFSGTVKSTGRKSKPVRGRIFLHGFLEVSKWHLVMLYHYLYKTKFREDLNKLKEELKLPSICSESLEEKIRDPYNYFSCKNVKHCVKEEGRIIRKTNKILGKYLKEYMEEVVTFLEKRGSNSGVDRLSLSNLGEGFLSVGMKFLKEDVFGRRVMVVRVVAESKDEVMVLGGVTYPGLRNGSRDIPDELDIHLNVITFYPKTGGWKGLRRSGWDFEGKLRIFR